MRRFVAAVLAQRLAIYTCVVVFTLAGLAAVFTLPEGVYPRLELSRVNVRAENGELAPALVQPSIARPLERELSSILGVEELLSTSTQGAADISVTFDPHVASPDIALGRIFTAVATVQNQLPPNTHVRVEPIGSNLFPVVTYALTSRTLSAVRLRELVENDIRPQLTGLPGVALTSVAGGDTREFLVAVDPARLAAHRIPLRAVGAAIAASNTIEAVGHTDAGYVRSTILASGLAHTPQDVANVTLAAPGGVFTRIGDVATVSETTAPPTVRATTLGHAAVLLNVFGQPGTSDVEVARAVSTAMAKALADAPNVSANRFWDVSALVSASIANLRDAILVGLGLSALVLFFFLRSWRSTLIAGITIPITMLMTFAAMRFLGQSLNLMTLGGLAIGVGLVIDDAIVVVENVHRHLGIGRESRGEAIATAVGEIAYPMIASTLTTIVVFAPLSLLSGIAGAFFAALSISLSVALVISLVLALVFTPNVTMNLSRRERRHDDRLLPWLSARYEAILRRGLARPAAVFACSAVLIACAVVVGSQLGSDFLPALDEGAFEFTYTLPPGTSLSETERVAGKIARIIDADPAVARSASVIGASMTLINTDTPQGQNGGTMRATLRPSRDARIDTVMARIGGRVASTLPNVQFTTRQLLQDGLNDLSSQAAPIEVRLYGPEQAVLVPLAVDAAARIASVPGVAGAYSGVVYHDPSVVVTTSPGASALGVDAATLGTDARALFGGDVVSRALMNPSFIPVRVRYDTPPDATTGELEQLPYVTPRGDVTSLAHVATFTPSPPQSDITERDGRRYVAVTAQIAGSNLGAIAAGIEARMHGLELPPGYTYEIAGSYALQHRSFSQFSLAIGLSIALVFIVMLAQFRAVFQPLAILAAIPLAAFGAAVALAVTHITVNVSSLMGIILLIGLVVKNGILLLEYAAQRERAGDSRRDALLDAARIRLRPILMTTATALLGMLPLALAIGSGSELLQPLAVAVIGGLAFSTAATLVVVPVLYSVLAGFAERGRHKSAVAAALIVVAVAGFDARPARAAEPLTLDVAIASAARRSDAATSLALGNAGARAAAVPAGPRLAFGTALSAQPMAGEPEEYLLAPQVVVDFGARGRRAASLATTRAGVDVAVARFAGIRRDATQTVVDAFFVVAGEQAMYAAQRDALRLADRALDAARARRSQGVAPALDVVRADAERAARAAERDAARIALADDLETLADLTGVATTAVTVPDALSPLPEAPDVVRAARLASPSVASARAAASAADADARSARAALSPGVVAAVGPGLSSIGNARSVAPVANVSLDLPLDDRLERASVEHSDAAALVARADLEEREREASVVALHARALADAARARVAGLQVADMQARVVADADLAGYRLGAVPSADLILAQSRAADARATLEDARIRAARALVDLRIAMGTYAS